jgi:hypothetical protein
MSLADLLDEANALSRLGTLLVESGTGQPVAFWHGISASKPCITLLRNNEWLAVVPDDDQSGYIQKAAVPPTSGLPLYAKQYKSLPPIEAIFRFGSSVIEQYLTENGWSRDDEMNDNFPDKAAHDYVKVWMENCPLYSDGVTAVSGGWHFPWPENDFFDLACSELIVWTLTDSEPWIEVFATGESCRVLQRVS